jgi:F0F1-type ATP synthase membrane subunit b/b'
LDEIKAAVEVAEKAADTVKKLGIYEFIILVAVVVGFLIFWKVLLPRMMKMSELKTHDEIKESEAKAHKELMSFQDLVVEVKQIVENYNNRFQKLEEQLDKDAENREARKVEVDGKLSGIEAKMEIIIKKQFKVSQGTLENMLFNERLSIFKRLKAFRRLLAMGVNGDIKKEGLKLVLANKETWKIVLQTRLGIKIKDLKYYEDTMAYINKIVFDDSKA